MVSNPILSGTVCHHPPYRGGLGGTPTQCASVPRVPYGSGTPAHVVESTSYTVCHQVGVPPVLCVPPMRTNRVGWHTQKPTVSSARIGHQKANEQAALIIAGNPEKYPGVMQAWARLVIEKQTATIRGPLFAKEVVCLVGNRTFGSLLATQGARVMRLCIPPSTKVKKQLNRV